jgi:glycerol uptake facilitator-like aquaporin
MKVRSTIATLVAELIGTAVLTTAVINISRSQIGIGYFVAIGVGLTYGLLMLVFGSTWGSHFNPAVTLGQWTVRRIGHLMAVGYLAAQFLGAVLAWRLAEYFTGDTLRNIAGRSFETKNLIAEAVATFVFTFILAAAIYQGFRGLRFASAAGGALFTGIIVASLVTNGILNPAVALGAQSWGLAYAVGPLIGGIVGFNLYALLFAPESVWSLPTRAGRVRTVEPVETSSATVVSTRSADRPTARRSAAKRTTTTRRKTTGTRTRTRR